MIIHTTPGIIPLEALTTVGVSAKLSDDAIGEFGTGFKYAVAGILRRGGSVTIVTDGGRYDFSLEPLTIRGSTFNRVLLNGVPTGFTAELGKKWQPEMLFRELHSNTLDEGGTSYEALSPRGEGSHIIVDLEDYTKAFHTRHEMFLDTKSLTVIAHGSEGTIYEGASRHIYYRGIKVYTHDCTYPFTLDKAQADLTEDRTLRTTWEIPYNYANLAGLNRQAAEAYIKFFKINSQNINHSAQFGANNHIYELLKQRMLGGKGYIPVNLITKLKSRMKEDGIWSEAPYTMGPREARMLERAITFLAKAGYTTDTPIVVRHLSSDILGSCEFGEITISPKNFAIGQRQLEITLFEEIAHEISGYADQTHAFQEYLISRVLWEAEARLDAEGKL